jgi:hypothetical protein
MKFWRADNLNIGQRCVTFQSFTLRTCSKIGERDAHGAILYISGFHTCAACLKGLYIWEHQQGKEGGGGNLILSVAGTELRDARTGFLEHVLECVCTRKCVPESVCVCVCESSCL